MSHNPPHDGAMAQLGARLHGMQKVEGSSPSGSIKISLYGLKNAGRDQNFDTNLDRF